jgi:hypothetical protein
VQHLRLHQDLINIVLPRMTVSATSVQFGAMYNIATNLLRYQDPEHAERAKRIDAFLLAFDRKDRDPARTIIDIYHQQQAVIELRRVVQSYEADIDGLSESERRELLSLRNDLLEEMDRLFTISDAIAVAMKREKARASLVHSTRTNVKVGSIAWDMLQKDSRSLVKLDVDGFLLAWVVNKDNSTDLAFRVNDLMALNSDPGAHFFEVLTRLDVKMGGGKHKEVRRPFLSAAWSIANSVGGIPIVREARLYLHPIRVAIEEQVGRSAIKYVFPEREGRKDEEKEKARRSEKHKGLIKGMGGHKGDPNTLSASNLDLAPLARSKSSISVTSQASGVDRARGDERITLVSSKDAEEMRQRASSLKHWHQVKIDATTISLSFKVRYDLYY